MEEKDEEKEVSLEERVRELEFELKQANSDKEMYFKWYSGALVKVSKLKEIVQNLASAMVELNNMSE